MNSNKHEELVTENCLSRSHNLLSQEIDSVISTYWRKPYDGPEGAERATNYVGPVVTIVDNMDPEALAMLQAAYSRTHKPVRERLAEMGIDSSQFLQSKLSGAKKARDSMRTYYLNYGHASIADCGSTTIFIEGVSMLLAKAIQDNPLYNGQESSTRYIDFSSNAILLGNSNVAEEDLAKTCMDFHDKWYPRFTRAFEQLYDSPREASQETRFANACKAAAFDVIRCVLPSGMTTQLSWTTTLRKAREMLVQLRIHPLAEARQLAIDLYGQLAEIYPSSFDTSLDEINAPITEFELLTYHQRHYSVMASPSLVSGDMRLWGSPIKELKSESDGYHMCLRQNYHGDMSQLTELATAYAKQPADTTANLPKSVNGLATLTFGGPIDFGSYRDIQRHRTFTPIRAQPAVCAFNGFNGQYTSTMIQLAQLLDISDRTGVQQREELESDLRDLLDLFSYIGTEQLGILRTYMLRSGSPTPLSSQYYLEGLLKLATLQYCLPMGTLVLAEFTAGLADFQYVARLRSGKTVHPTVRLWLKSLNSAHQRRKSSMSPEPAVDVVNSLFGDRLADLTEGSLPVDSFSMKRGGQTFATQLEMVRANSSSEKVND